MHRVEEVLDCWLESASMPYAQLHYPFENKEKFEANFPGDYIVEYVPQTRAWFYVMHVISTALFGTSSFKNAICHGTINGTDGRKMSKSYGNYPDPKGVLEKFGGDAFRMAMANSVLPQGEDVNISEEGIGQQVKDLLMPLMNIYKYFGLYANQHNFAPQFGLASNNILDRWVIARVKKATQTIQESLDSYDVQSASRELKPLLDDISAWYIRRSRDRFVAGDGEALNTLFTSLFLALRAMAPFTPFIAEFVYMRIKHALPEMMQLGSIHLHLFDGFNEVSADEQQLLNDMDHVRTTASLALSIRDEKQLPVKQPLASVVFAAPHDLPQELREIIQSEVNVLSISQVATAGDIPGSYIRKDREELSVALDIVLTPELIEKGVMREVVRSIQVSRKKSGFELGEKAKATLTTHEDALIAIIEKYSETICAQTGLASLDVNKATVEGEHGELFTVKQGEYPLAVSLAH
jgi:isoleucyl-tRNA synthetase